jgi:hypothetical protein
MCQATIPNGGALLLEGNNPSAPEEKKYWMLVRPVLVDAKGNPIKR